MDKKRSVLQRFSASDEVDYYNSIAIQGMTLQEENFFSGYLKGKKVLDVGCGCGREAIALAKKGFEVTAVDFSSKMIWCAKKAAEKAGVKIHFMIEDIEFLEVRPQFDTILLFSQVIEHVPSMERRVRVLTRLTSFLAEDGVILLTAHERAHTLFYKIYWKIKSLLMKKDGEELGDVWIDRSHPSIQQGKEKMYFHLSSRAELQEMVNKSHLDLIKLFCDVSREGAQHYYAVLKKKRL